LNGLPTSNFHILPFAVALQFAQQKPHMDLKRLITHFTYHVEPKPDGGFIARASDPTLPPLEAPTRWELEEKVRQNISAALATEFPQLKLPLEQNQLKLSFHIERKPDGGFLIHSSDPNSPPAEAGSHEIESKFAEKLIGFVGKHVMPADIAQALAANPSGGQIKVFVRKTTWSTAGDPKVTETAVDTSARSSPFQTGPPEQDVNSDAGKTAGAPGAFNYAGDNGPIHRSSGNNWAALRFLLALLIIGAIIYFYLHHR
jgi:hypothetical protein